MYWDESTHPFRITMIPHPFRRYEKIINNINNEYQYYILERLTLLSAIAICKREDTVGLMIGRNHWAHDG